MLQALGEYTASVDFAALPARDKTKGGDLWYDDLLNAYFDDQEHFKTIKALCRLSCSVCVQAGESGKPLPRGYVQPDTVFRDIDQLKQHLFGIHKLVMCELCLEGRKVSTFASQAAGLQTLKCGLVMVEQKCYQMHG